MKVKVSVVKTAAEGYRRAGLVLTHVPTAYDLDADTIAALACDPKVIVAKKAEKAV